MVNGMAAYYKHKQPNKDLKKKESLSNYQKRVKKTEIDKELGDLVLKF